MTDTRFSPGNETPERLDLAVRRLRAAVNGDDFDCEFIGGSPFDDVQVLLVEYDRLVARPNGAAQPPMDREQIAKIFAYIWHGDLGEWRGFLSKADAFLAYPRPPSPVAGEVTIALHKIAQLTNVGRGDLMSLQDALRDIHKVATDTIALSSTARETPELADRWPLGCHSPNSCSRNGRCMYIGCKHDGKDIKALATAFPPAQSGGARE